MNRKIRSGNGTFMGTDVLILHTIGRRSGTPRDTPVSWFPGPDGSWELVASGGTDGDPDWFRNLMAHPDQATVTLPNGDPVAVTPQVLTGADRAQSWNSIVEAQPRYGKYQAKAGRDYNIVRLATN
ncbi:nitroreductase family deazaflavin-dependent oxidoreductase [Nocardia camponoti]|nr:nitroreductase family deazaflavin-dependent oxidoreductase [Nocardia camponoti]